MKKIVLLHGAIGASDQLEKLKQELSNEFSVYTMDFIGHGTRSNEVSEFSIENFAKDLDDFLIKNRISNPIIFGYSMGGYVGLYQSLHFSNKAERIITLGTKFHWNIEGAKKETKMLDANLILEKVPQFAEQLKNRHGAENWRNVLENTSKMMMKMGENNPFSSQELKNLSSPIRFGIGDRDQMVGLEETVEYYKAAANGSLYVMPNTHHPIEKVKIDELAFQILKFSKEI